MDVGSLARELRREALATDERRLLVLAGDRERGYDALTDVLDAVSVPIAGTTLVGPDDRLRCERLPVANADRLLGTTRDAVVLDAHDAFRPNALARCVGAVDGGGLVVLLTPALSTWPDRRDGFDASLVVPPFELGDVTGRFRRRFVELLRAHRGVAIVDLDGGEIVDDGLTRPAPALAATADGPGRPEDSRFPDAVYDACLTADQVEAVAAFESFLGADGGRRAVVLEADRGRGKSSAAGLAAGAFAVDGMDVLVTAPRYRNATAVFDRAEELRETLEAGASTERTESSTERTESSADGTESSADGTESSADGKESSADGTESSADGRESSADGTESPTAGRRRLETAAGGRVRFLAPEDAVADDRIGSADVLVVDEAAALPVPLLESTLAADRIAFATTVHGYEGAGRGFSVRFRERLAASDHAVTDVTLVDPIRYAPGDPIEVWLFRALALDARPPVESLVADATPETVDYRRLEPEELLADERLLREAFGLLVLAHYRTEPDDLARLLDAPNLEGRALLYDGHVVSVALLAREGGLPPETRARMYEGERIRGNMLPDVLTSQLRDEGAGEPTGVRLLRIATHHAVRSRGIGSRLLECVRTEFAADVDWLGAGFGATPELLAFWERNGYGTVHLSTTRNDASGEHSALVLAPTSADGRALSRRHAGRFVRRLPAVASDTLSGVDPDVLAAALASVDATPPLELTDDEWRIVAGAAYGPGLLDVDPGPFRRLVVRYLVDDPELGHTARERRLLVRRLLQARDWTAVATELEYPSTGACMRAAGDALKPLVDRYGGTVADEVCRRFDG